MYYCLLRRCLLVLVLVFCCQVSGATAQSEKTRPEKTQAESAPVLAKQKLVPLMQMKLERSKQILEGLTMEDFEKIASGARALRLLSLESGWNVLQTEEYSEQSKDFRRNTALIDDAAKEKDLGRATLGYVALTVRCVECHSYIRKQRGKLDRP